MSSGAVRHISLRLLFRQRGPVNIALAHRAFADVAGNTFLIELLADTRRAISFAATAANKLANKATVVKVAVLNAPGDNGVYLFRRDVQRLRAIFPSTGAASLRRSSCSLWSRIARIRIARSSRRA
jgi:hypothetical protein